MLNPLIFALRVKGSHGRLEPEGEVIRFASQISPATGLEIDFFFIYLKKVEALLCARH